MAQANSGSPDVKKPYAPRGHHAVLALKGRYPPRTSGPVDREEVIRELSAFGPLDKKLLDSMSIPRMLNRVDEGKFSSDPKKPAFSITHRDFLDAIDQNQFPDYSIAIGSRGSNVFCTLIDLKRGILVSASIKNMFVREGNWSYFQSLIESALKKAEGLTEKQKKAGILAAMIS